MIEQPSKKKMLLFTGSSNPKLAEKVAGELGTTLALVDKKQFASGEIYIRLEESARGADCFVMQSHSGEVNFTIIATMTNTGKKIKIAKMEKTISKTLFTKNCIFFITSYAYLRR